MSCPGLETQRGWWGPGGGWNQTDGAGELQRETPDLQLVTEQISGTCCALGFSTGVKRPVLPMLPWDGRGRHTDWAPLGIRAVKRGSPGVCGVGRSEEAPREGGIGAESGRVRGRRRRVERAGEPTPGETHRQSGLVWLSQAVRWGHVGGEKCCCRVNRDIPWEILSHLRQFGLYPEGPGQELQLSEQSGWVEEASMAVA